MRRIRKFSDFKFSVTQQAGGAETKRGGGGFLEQLDNSNDVYIHISVRNTDIH